MGELEPGDDEEDALEREFDDAEDSVENEFASDEEEDDDFGTERELCPDESCVGVLNAQGICGECGTQASASSETSVSVKEGEPPPRKRRESKQGQDVDLLHRRLCPDGSCVGLLGPDGRCKECGLVGESVFTDPRLQGLKTPAIEEDEDPPETGSKPEAPSKKKKPSSNEADLSDDSPQDKSGDFAQRRLCPDGACIGIIGPAGTCNECGTVL